MDLAKSMLGGVCLDRSKFQEAEMSYHTYLAKQSGATSSSVVSAAGDSQENVAPVSALQALKLENDTLRTQIAALVSKFSALESRLSTVEKQCGCESVAAPAAKTQEAPKAAAVESEEDEESDDDSDLFGSDDEDDEAAEKIKQERIAKYTERKSKKTAVVARSNIVLDVKPWDDETDMDALEKCVRSVECDGLVWGASKLVKIAYGVMKLQIVCVVEDDKVGTDFLEDKICAFEDYIQSLDIVAFNKV